MGLGMGFDDSRVAPVPGHFYHHSDLERIVSKKGNLGE